MLTVVQIVQLRLHLWTREGVWGQRAPHHLPAEMNKVNRLAPSLQQVSCSTSWWLWMKGKQMLISLFTQNRQSNRSESNKCCKRHVAKKMQEKLTLETGSEDGHFFWVLPKVSQDCLLWSMQQNCLPCDEQDDESESGSDSSCQPRHKVAWSIEGREWIVPIEVIFRQFMFKSLYFNNTKGWVPHCQEFLCAAKVFWDTWVSVPRGWWGPGKRSKALTSGAWVPHLPSYDLFFWSTVISYWMPFVELVLFVFAHPHYYSYPSGG